MFWLRHTLEYLTLAHMIKGLTPLLISDNTDLVTPSKQAEHFPSRCVLDVLPYCNPLPPPQTRNLTVREGYDKHNAHKDGYDEKTGLDVKGHDREGFDIYNYDRCGEGWGEAQRDHCL